MKLNYSIENDFFELCYDCLYYGYKWAFIKNNYTEFINTLGVENAKIIYNKAYNKICND